MKKLISAKEPPQSFVPGLLITFLKEKGYGDSKGSKTHYNQSAKEDYLNLKPEEQAEIFAEFYSKCSARDESGALIDQDKKKELAGKITTLSLSTAPALDFIFYGRITTPGLILFKKHLTLQVSSVLKWSFH